MSDERDGVSSADTDSGGQTDDGDRGQTAVVTRPLRPTGKRSRRAGEAGDADKAPEADSSGSKDDDGSGPKAKKKTAKKPKDGPSRNPLVFVINYLKEVVGELRKVIWPNRKEMATYTTVVLLFLVFMVALIGGVDLGLGKLVTWIFA
ncbi:MULTISPECIES: preprotein translocase subunit SecE [Mycolicibacterium]|mgnify:CR=1 FL=1|uniref:Protein translocase subunit SecE n=2 Tax=Mycolicibacterium TaxID=1866885 RepID=A1T4G8_MYCVP|nr:MULTISPECIES: preprotein translocase subunit SecE [Mycolicibacterium]ABM12068.1 protein translocase subunit secE/sec61 gamma [Mycolicibacterium vanbaalenii PYR-1]MDN4516303.1 preprotein translocase subunit SecE [Mycolicibacterium austroafricanum]MDW5613743.1 preprotein translocase subunit SecE [Mycolicibacterium sp. D5.8-2]PQP49353.1 preprotein translocase subunit SecE [Mycolicibacterium austroafricanum]QRZ07888.1 preprotein translocase subunit SecE [Mycolicibacterium austroafricanum]